MRKLRRREINFAHILGCWTRVWTEGPWRDFQSWPALFLGGSFVAKKYVLCVFLQKGSGLLYCALQDQVVIIDKNCQAPWTPQSKEWRVVGSGRTGWAQPPFPPCSGSSPPFFSRSGKSSCWCKGANGRCDFGNVRGANNRRMWGENMAEVSLS